MTKGCKSRSRSRILCSLLKILNVAHCFNQNSPDLNTDGRWMYGAIRWSLADIKTQSIIVTIESLCSAWRLSTFLSTAHKIESCKGSQGCFAVDRDKNGRYPIMNFGDGSFTTYFPVEVTHILESLDMLVGRTVYFHVYNDASKYYDIQLNLCCRIAGNQNSFLGLQLATRVDLTNPVMITGSPQIFSLPFIDLYPNQLGTKVRSIFVRAVSQRGVSLNWTLAAVGQYGSVYSLLPSETRIKGLKSATGEILIDMANESGAFCFENIQIVINVFDGTIFSCLDFIIRIHGCECNHHTTPRLIAPETLKAFVNVKAGQVIKLSVKFEAQVEMSNHSVHFEYSELPPAATIFNEVRCNGNCNGTMMRDTFSASSTVNWMRDRPGELYVCVAAYILFNRSECSNTSHASYKRSMPVCTHIIIENGVSVQEVRAAGLQVPKCQQLDNWVTYHLYCGSDNKSFHYNMSNFSVPLSIGDYPDIWNARGLCDNDAGLCVVEDCLFGGQLFFSISIPKGLYVNLFSEENFTGHSLRLNGNIEGACLSQHVYGTFDGIAKCGHWNKSIKSVIIRTTSQITSSPNALCLKATIDQKENSSKILRNDSMLYALIVLILWVAGLYFKCSDILVQWSCPGPCLDYHESSTGNGRRIILIEPGKCIPVLSPELKRCYVPTATRRWVFVWSLTACFVFLTTVTLSLVVVKTNAILVVISIIILLPASLGYIGFQICCTCPRWKYNGIGVNHTESQPWYGFPSSSTVFKISFGRLPSGLCLDEGSGRIHGAMHEIEDNTRYLDRLFAVTAYNWAGESNPVLLHWRFARDVSTVTDVTLSSMEDFEESWACFDSHVHGTDKTAGLEDSEGPYNQKKNSEFLEDLSSMSSMSIIEPETLEAALIKLNELSASEQNAIIFVDGGGMQTVLELLRKVRTWKGHDFLMLLKICKNIFQKQECRVRCLSQDFVSGFLKEVECSEPSIQKAMIEVLNVLLCSEDMALESLKSAGFLESLCCLSAHGSQCGLLAADLLESIAGYSMQVDFNHTADKIWFLPLFQIMKFTQQFFYSSYPFSFHNLVCGNDPCFNLPRQFCSHKNRYFTTYIGSAELWNHMIQSASVSDTLIIRTLKGINDLYCISHRMLKVIKAAKECNETLKENLDIYKTNLDWSLRPLFCRGNLLRLHLVGAGVITHLVDILKDPLQYGKVIYTVALETLCGLSSFDDAVILGMEQASALDELFKCFIKLPSKIFWDKNGIWEEIICLSKNASLQSSSALSHQTRIRCMISLALQYLCTKERITRRVVEHVGMMEVLCDHLESYRDAASFNLLKTLSRCSIHLENVAPGVKEILRKVFLPERLHKIIERNCDPSGVFCTCLKLFLMSPEDFHSSDPSQALQRKAAVCAVLSSLKQLISLMEDPKESYHNADRKIFWAGVTGRLKRTQESYRNEDFFGYPNGRLDIYEASEDFYAKTVILRRALHNSQFLNACVCITSHNSASIPKYMKTDLYPRYVGLGPFGLDGLNVSNPWVDYRVELENGWTSSEKYSHTLHVLDYLQAIRLFTIYDHRLARQIRGDPQLECVLPELLKMASRAIVEKDLTCYRVEMCLTRNVCRRIKLKQLDDTEVRTIAMVLEIFCRMFAQDDQDYDVHISELIRDLGCLFEQIDKWASKHESLITYGPIVSKIHTFTTFLLNPIPFKSLGINDLITSTFSEGFVLPAELRGKYKLDTKPLLGRGGFGFVLKVFQTDLGLEKIPGALKIVTSSVRFSAEERLALVREALCLRCIESPNVVRCFNFGFSEIHNYFWLIMEFLDGKSLDRILSEGGIFDEVQVLQIADQLLSGLAAVHSAKLVHRDIKPGNIMQVVKNNVYVYKLIDFGLVHFVDAHTTDTHYTELAGTLVFMSPELFRGSKFCTSADIWALGITLYLLASGRLPYEPHENMITEDYRDWIANQIQSQEKIPCIRNKLSTNTHISDGFCEILERALQKDVLVRFQSAEEMQLEIQLLNPKKAYQFAEYLVKLGALQAVRSCFLQNWKSHEGVEWIDNEYCGKSLSSRITSSMKKTAGKQAIPKFVLKKVAEGDSRKWDFTVFANVLLFSPVNPLALDSEDRSDIETLRNWRNELSHTFSVEEQPTGGYSHCIKTTRGFIQRHSIGGQKFEYQLHESMLVTQAVKNRNALKLSVENSCRLLQRAYSKLSQIQTADMVFDTTGSLQLRHNKETTGAMENENFIFGCIVTAFKNIVALSVTTGLGSGSGNQKFSHCTDTPLPKSRLKESNKGAKQKEQPNAGGVLMGEQHHKDQVEISIFHVAKAPIPRGKLYESENQYAPGHSDSSFSV